MAEYIERETFLKDIEERYCLPCKEAGRNHNGCKCRACWVDDMCGEVIDAPAADVEPLVRCMDCKYHYWEQESCHGKTVHYCELPHMRGIEIFKEFFCYYGERKDGDK